MIKTTSGIFILFETAQLYEKVDLKYLIGTDIFEHFIEKSFIKKTNKGFQISYVGLITYEDKTICVLPKHCFYKVQVIKQNPEAYLISQAIQLIKVLRKYHSKIVLNLRYRFDEGEFEFADNNELGLAEFLFEHYLSHGLWSFVNSRTILDGEGEINWEMTIDELNPIFKKSYPIYYETYNRIDQVDNSNILTQIHLASLKYCSHKYSELLNIKINIDEGVVSDLTELGSTTYLVYIIDKQLRMTYKDSEISLLKALKQLVINTESSTKIGFSLYGKNKFDSIWEDCLNEIFTNQYSIYKFFLNGPRWFDSKMPEIINGNNLKPDILKLITIASNNCLLILDAKYYIFRGNDDKILNFPGVQDVVKQYFYQISMMRGQVSHKWEKKIERVINILIFPKNGSTNTQELEFEGVVEIENDCINNPIYNISIDPDKAFNRYINNIPFKDDEIEQFISSILRGSIQLKGADSVENFR